MIMSAMMPNSQQCGCGTMGKCSGCMFKLICDKSPYCRLLNNSSQDNVGLTDKLDEVLQGLEVLNQNIQVINEGNKSILTMLSALNNLSQEIVKIESTLNDSVIHINDIDNYVKKINKSIENDTICHCHCEEDDEDRDDSYIEEDNVISSDTTEIAPYNSIDNQNNTILVEKKGLFGKSKWVEKKK